MPKKATPEQAAPAVTPEPVVTPAPAAVLSVSPEYAQARRRVRAYKLFFAHAIVFVVVNALLLLIDVATGGGLWFYWPLFGWGIGLAAHAGILWGAPRVHAWEERMITHEMRRQAQ